ncbi:Mpp10 protein [Piedraia hortae CBS 480.64]|uniref:U3 small nucleolar ribonucleoprotein protein MPP10 n=1 Tax=Piedraia hortae CBS 480.64 TaxID=1314780 RepID=A0A6A7CAE8_9PEZI|nr:Mpp10 protein [Piedraia hortae CBS 480.64]
MAQLTTTLTDSPCDLLNATHPLYNATLESLTKTIDPLAADVCAAQEERLREARKRRKRGRVDVLEKEKPLKVRKLYTEGFETDQVWEQTRRVIEAALEEVGRVVDKEGVETKRDALQDGVEEAQDEEMDNQSEHEDMDDHTEDDVKGGEREAASVNEDEPEAGLKEEEGFSSEAEQDDSPETEQSNSEKNEEKTEKSKLNSRFFSIDDFNKQSALMERRDANGEVDENEEEIDWDAPLAASGDEEDEEGPGFGDPDAPSEDDEVQGGEMDDALDLNQDLSNAPKFDTFFGSQDQAKKTKAKPKPRSLPQDEDVQSDSQSETEGLAAMKEGDDSDEAIDPKNMSNHERNKATMQRLMKEYEKVNVGQRDWTLMGEARAADREENSLLPVDLEWERQGKPLAAMTAETNESVEDMIKRAISESDFQTLQRRRPQDLATGPTRRGRVDVDLGNGKDRKGLADEYAEEYLRLTDSAYVDAQDERTKKQHQEISKLWEEARTALDGLSSWHFRPKAPVPQLEIRTDAPTITLEDAQPNAEGAVTASQLAPQEIYKAGEASKGVRKEVTSKGGLPAAREELDRDEKKRRRRRQKERIRKSNSNTDQREKNGKTKNKEKEKEEKDIVGQLKKGGVMVIGKKGQVTDMDGKDSRGTRKATGASFKL